MPEAGVISPEAFRPLIVRAIVFPIAMVVVLVAILIWQVSRLIAAAEWVQHTDEVISQLHELEKLHVDLDSGLRAFLLTRDRTKLTLLEETKAAIVPMVAKMLDMVRDNPQQVSRIEKAGELRGRWLAYAQERIDHPPTGDGLGDPALYAPGRALLEAMRAEFATMVKTEENLRQVRTTATRRSATLTVVTACASALICGAVLVLFSRRQLDILSQEYERALSEVQNLNQTLETRIAERTEELHVSNGKLVDANKELEAFSYSVSHDLRAPMRHISGFAEMLRRGLGDSLDQDSAENLQTIRDTARQAGMMVDDLLSFSRMGRTEMRETSVDTSTLIEIVLNEQARDTGGRGIDFRTGELPCVRADPALLKLVFQNLISNAIKYTRKVERPTIEIGSEVVDGTREFFVKDNGVGFDMRYVDKLFGVFQRLHRAEDFEGTGIGLANVRRIIERHGGTVRAEAEPDKGATFYFTLGRQ